MQRYMRLTIRTAVMAWGLLVGCLDAFPVPSLFRTRTLQASRATLLPLRNMDGLHLVKFNCHEDDEEGAEEEEEEESKGSVRRFPNEQASLTWVSRRLQEQPLPGMLSKNVLQQMVPAMSAWARRKSLVGAQRAENLLQRYVDEYLVGNESAVLSVRLFNAVMDGYAKSGATDAPRRVEGILRWMRELRKEHSLDNIRPDVVSMSTLVAAWARCGAFDAAKNALAIVQYMERHGKEWAPNTITYNTVLHALAVSPLSDKAKRAEQLVEHMKERYEAGHRECQPDVFTYQSLISTLSRSGLKGAPQKAEQLLQFLNDQYKAGYSRLEPNSYCYSAVIHAWSNSMEPNKARQAYAVLQQMRELYEVKQNFNVRPNKYAYTAVISACASPVNEDEKEEAFRIAQLTMEELWYSKHGRANFVSYAAFLNVCATTLPPGEYRDVMVERTFRQCCRAGQVGSLVLEKFAAAACPELYRELLQEAFETDANGMETIRVPTWWRRNVKGEKRHATKVRHATQTNVESKQPQHRTVLRLQDTNGEKREGPAQDEDTINIDWTVATL